MNGMDPRWVAAREEGKLVRVNTLRKGQRFLSMNSTEWIYGHEHRGCCYVTGLDGFESCFAACASVLPV